MILLEKNTQRQVDNSVLYKQLKYIVHRALSGSRSKQGWVYEGHYEVKKTDKPDGYIYSHGLEFIRRGTKKVSETIIMKQHEYIKKIVAQAGNSSGWFIKGFEGVDKTDEPPQSDKTFADTTEKVSIHDAFKHLYNRDAQISVVNSAIEQARLSNFTNRFHCLLYGEPACAKTEIMHGFKKVLGNDAVLQFDATSMTQAGAEKVLLESARVPAVLMVEEIEKTEEKTLRFLLGLLDYRAEIRKTNFNVGNIRREVKLLCIATANDMGKFKSMLDGALASRFCNKVYCPRPDRKVLEMILEREVKKINGNMAWVAPAIDYCTIVEKTNDPRRIISVCLCGRDELLNGKYQAALKLCQGPLQEGK